MIGFTDAAYRIARERMSDMERQARRIRAIRSSRGGIPDPAAAFESAIRDQEAKIRTLFAHRRHLTASNS